MPNREMVIVSSPVRPRHPGFRKHFARAGLPYRPEYRFLNAADGTRLFYAVENPEHLEDVSRPVLVFCYGLVCSSLHWTYQIESLRSQFTCLWVDYRGHQNSDIPKDLSTLTIEQLAADVGQVLGDFLTERRATAAARADRPFVVFGHSMGVNVALEVARQFPSLVRGIVLANGTARRPLETIFHGNFSETTFAALKALHRLSAPIFQKWIWKLNRDNPFSTALVALGGFNPALSDRSDIQLYVNQVIDMNPEIYLRLMETYGRYDATPWLHSLQVPTLILSGSRDHMTPLPESELMRQLIPGAELVVFPFGSHCPQMDMPELVTAKLFAFCETLIHPVPGLRAASPSTEIASQSNHEHP